MTSKIFNPLLLWLSLLFAIVVGCSTEDNADVKPDDDAEGFYGYVLGYDESIDKQRTGGGHEIIIPRDRGKPDAIDSANQPSRLHPALGDVLYQTYDATLAQGQSSWNIFPSSWWPQSKSGIAYRYDRNKDWSKFTNSDQLSPIERYDHLFYPNQSSQVAKVDHWNIKDLKKEADKRDKKHEHKALTVIGPATKWELENHGIYSDYSHPDTWWGHCNGWASYVTAEEGSYPKRDIRVKLIDDKITECVDIFENDQDCTPFRKADIEGLMSELYFSDKATLAGRRCNTEADKIERDNYGRPVDPACRDLNPGSWHIGLTGLLTRGAKSLVNGEFTQIPFVIDHTYDAQVWNYPVKSYKIFEQREMSKEEAINRVGLSGSDYSFNQDAQQFVFVRMEYTMVDDAVTNVGMIKVANERNVVLTDVKADYILELDSNRKIIGGEWLKRPVVESPTESGKLVDLHPDFYWMATDPIGYSELFDDQGGDSDNPFVRYSHVKALLSCANDPATCAPSDDNIASTWNGLHKEGTIEKDVPLYFQTETLPAGDYVFILAAARDDADIDLYVRKGKKPTRNVYDCRPFSSDSNEFCQITLDQRDTIHVMLDASATSQSSETYDLRGESVAGDSSEKSCRNHCDQEGPIPQNAEPFFCYCSQGCEEFGDCCSDKALVCG